MAKGKDKVESEAGEAGEAEEDGEREEDEEDKAKGVAPRPEHGFRTRRRLEFWRITRPSCEKTLTLAFATQPWRSECRIRIYNEF